MVQRAARHVLAGQDVRRALRPGDSETGLLERAVIEEALRLRRAEMRDVSMEAADRVVEGVGRLFEVLGLIEFKEPAGGE